MVEHANEGMTKRVEQEREREREVAEGRKEGKRRLGG